MKKLLPLIMALVLVCSIFALVGCGGNDTNTDNAPDEDLAAAYEYIKENYKSLSVTSKNFEVMKNAPVGDKNFAITWSTDKEAITITESEDGNSYVVNIPELGDAAINYTLKFSIQNEKGEKKAGSFNLTVPAFGVNTHAEYVAAEDGTALIVQGIVTGVISKSTNSTKENSLFLQDLNGEGGYYIYGLEDDPNGVISVGQTVEARGNKKNYNGTYELIDASVTIVDSTVKTVTPVDFTEVLASASALNAKELTDKNGMLVTIKGVTLLEYLDSNGYHYFQLGNHKSYLRVSSSSNCITKAEGTTLTASFQANFYNLADVTGLIAVYNGNMYLMPVSVDAFTNVVEQEKPDNAKADAALANTTLPGIIQTAGNTTLPTTFSGFSDVTISWELVDGASVATLNGATLTVTIPEDAATVVVKATAACGDYSSSKEYSIVVKEIETITIEEANTIGDKMARNTYTEELYYIVGTIESITSESYGNLYITSDGDRIYIYGINGFSSMDPKPLKNDTIKVLSVVGKYNNDVQLKNAKIVEHTVHPDNEGMGTDEFTQMTIPEALAAADETKVKVSGTVISIDTAWNEQYSNICVTIVDADGNKLYLYRLSTKVEVGDIITARGVMATYNDARQLAQGGAATITGHDSSYDYTEMTISEALAAVDGKNVIVVGTVSEIKTEYSSQYNNISVYIKDADGNELYLYRLTGNIEVGKTIKVKGSMATHYGDRQVVGGTFEEVAAHTCTYTSVVTAPTCTEQGYTTHTCAGCGDSIVDTYVDALGHNFENGVCANGCGTTEHVHNYEAVVTAPTCTENGYITYTCNVGECGDSYTEPGEAATGAHVDENGNFKCDACEEIVLPEEGDTLTIAQVLALGALTTTTEKYYVTGTVKNVYNTTYGNMYITDGTNELCIYGTYSADGKIRYDAMEVKPVAGDTVTLYGVIGIYNDKPQINSGWLTEHTAHTCVGGDEASCITAQTCTACGKVLVEALGHNYVDGVCTRCERNQVSSKEEMSVSKSHTDVVTIAGVTAGQNTGIISNKNIALNDDITVVFAKGNSTSDPCIYSESIRVYQGGATVTFKAAEGCEITTIVIHLSSKSGGQGPISVVGGTASELSNLTYTITANEGVSEVVVTTTGTDKENRLYIDNIQVDYLK